MAGKVKFLSLMKPLMPFTPDVEQSIRRQTLRDRMVWTAIVLFIFLICSQIPLYGVVRSSDTDPMYLLRTILASNKGTLMELGISPIITSGMIIQLLAGAKIIDVDQTVKEDRDLFNAAQKFFGLIITFAQGLAYIFGGSYGTMAELGLFGAGIILAQLMIAGFIVILLDEVLQKGYGFGSGISLFIACNTAESILWRGLSPISIRTEQGNEFEGAIIAFFHLLITRSNKFSAISSAFFRSHAPNLSNLLATILIILLVIYFQGFRIELTVTSNRVRGYSQPYPIKLFYTSNMPIILQAAVVSNLYFFSQILHNRFAGNFLVNILGRWQEVDGGYSVPVGGITYYLSPPRDFFEIIRDPIHTAIYIIFIIGTCAFFSKTWIDISGSSARDVAKQLKDQGMTISGFREQYIAKELNRYIPTAAALGGVCIGALSVLADFIGAIGSGTGLLLAVTIIYSTFETITKERMKTGEALF